MGYKTFTCPVARRCGGCEWLAVPYPLQLKRKQEHIDDLFGSLLERFDVVCEPIAGMEDPRGYRHKAATPFAPGGRGRIRAGFYQKHTHKITSCPHCLVEAAGSRELLNGVARVLERCKVRAYREDEGTGLVRHAIVRMTHAGDAAMLTLVTNGEHIPHEKQVVRALRELDKRIVIIAQNINTRATNAILGSKTKILYGPPRLRDQLLGCSFEISPTAFYQTNPAQTEVLYSKALEYAALKPGETLMDAYCGSGTIGLCALKDAPQAYLVGVERTVEAIKDARRNARINGLEAHSSFVADDATEFLQACARGERALPKDIDVLVMDPPRAGSTGAFIKGVAALAIPRVVYVSCNPVSMRRDLDMFVSQGYALQRFGNVDMFPHTKHVETVCLMTRVR